MNAAPSGDTKEQRWSDMYGDVRKRSSRLKWSQLSGATRFLQPPISPCSLLYSNQAGWGWGVGGGWRWRWGGGRGGGGCGWWWLRFHPMRRLLTGSPSLDKSPLWSFSPKGDCTTSMGEHSFGCRGDRVRLRKGREIEGGRGRQLLQILTARPATPRQIGRAHV